MHIYLTCESQRSYATHRNDCIYDGSRQQRVKEFHNSQDDGLVDGCRKMPSELNELRLTDGRMDGWMHPHLKISEMGSFIM